jgi:hypothetical protein
VSLVFQQHKGHDISVTQKSDRAGRVAEPRISPQSARRNQAQRLVMIVIIICAQSYFNSHEIVYIAPATTLIVKCQLLFPSKISPRPMRPDFAR